MRGLQSQAEGPYVADTVIEAGLAVVGAVDTDGVYLTPHSYRAAHSGLPVAEAGKALHEGPRRHSEEATPMIEG